MIKNFTLFTSSFAIYLFFVVQQLTAQIPSPLPNDMPSTPTEFGKCYAKCRIPNCEVESFKTVKIKDESTTVNITPAVYETITEQVLVKEASSKLVPVPAQYETITEQVLIKEAATKITNTPAVYSTITERIMVAPGSGEWVKKHKGPNCFSSNPADCYIMCWEEIPARYETVTKQVLTQPAQNNVTEIPAEYKTITRRILKSPATVREEIIPAEYKSITRKVLRTPAQASTNTVPAEYESVSYHVIADYGGFTEWREILCADNQTGSVILQVQRALQQQGYKPGTADGILGKNTRQALEKYQQDNKLPVGNMNLETLKALGVNY